VYNGQVSDSYQSLAHLTKALGDANRLLILERLAQLPCAVEDLAAKTLLPLANLSHHLQVLKYAGLVKSARKGRQIVYALSGAQVVLAIAGLRNLSEQLSGEESRVTATLRMDRGPQVARDEVVQLVKEGRAIVLDVRPLDEYRAGHIRGAVHIPLDELQGRLDELPPGKMIIAYCRGPYCQLAVQATSQLKQRGRPAKTLEDGYPEWWAAGQPVDRLDKGF